MRGRPGKGMRGGPVRKGGRRVSKGKLGPKAKEMLQEARALGEAGKWSEAGAQFDEMARIAADRGMASMATKLSTKAAAAYAKAGDETSFEAATSTALEHGKADGQPDRSSRSFGEMLDAVQETSLSGMVGSLTDRVRSALGVAPKSVAARAAAGNAPVVNRTMRRNLPKVCATCGTAVEASAVHWNEDGSGDCSFCGSILTS